jgi:hypothetical protein
VRMKTEIGSFHRDSKPQSVGIGASFCGTKAKDWIWYLQKYLGDNSEKLFSRKSRYALGRNSWRPQAPACPHLPIVI